MTLGTEIIIVVAAALVVIGLGTYVILIYNGLVRLRNNVNKDWANIDVVLKQRHDELPNLIEAVKGYMGYERGLLDEITKLRESVHHAPTIHDKALASEALSGSLVTLFARAENYPNLRATENFQQLQQRISGLENELADRREFYNNSVNLLNIRIESFPDMYVAKLTRLQKQEMFKVLEEEKARVEVKFQ